MDYCRIISKRTILIWEDVLPHAATDGRQRRRPEQPNRTSGDFPFAWEALFPSILVHICENTSKLKLMFV
jgi:hypothetical protein